MRMLLPDVREVTVAEVYDVQPRARHDGRPWVVLSMISSVDGAIALDGASGALGCPRDQEIFLHLHRGADAVLVGAETVRADCYSPLPPHQQLFVVSRTGDLGRRGDELRAAGNTHVVEGEVRDIVAAIPGDVCALEGGPTLNGQMLAAGLVDEVCVTIAPRFVAGRSHRLAEGPFADRAEWTLAHLCEEHGFLFARYVR